MKKIILLTFVLSALFMMNINAQTFSIGPKIGLNFASVSDANQAYSGASTSSLTSFHFGGVLNIGLNDMFSIQPEVLYSQKGAEVKGTVDLGINPITLLPMTETFDVTGKENYLEIPILAKFSFVTGPVKLFANAGPYFAYEMSRTDKDNVSGTSTSTSDWTDLNRMDVGLAIGVGGAYGVGPGDLSLELRYDLGLTSIVTVQNGISSEKNGDFMISVAYLFKLGGK